MEKKKRIKEKDIKEIHLRDLLPEDKAKIARLVDQIVGLGIENDSLRKKIILLENQIKDILIQIENQTNETIYKLNEKVILLEKNRNNSLYLLNIYQQKISQFIFENQHLKRIQEESNERLNLANKQIQDLEELMLNQKSVIESSYEKQQVTQLSEDLLTETNKKLKNVSDEYSQFQIKYKQLEESSKYLANQLDELLPQLNLKNIKIKELETELLEERSSKIKNMVDSGSQTNENNFNDDFYENKIYDGIKTREDMLNLLYLNPKLDTNNFIKSTQSQNLPPSPPLSPPSPPSTEKQKENYYDIYSSTQSLQDKSIQINSEDFQSQTLLSSSSSILQTSNESKNLENPAIKTTITTTTTTTKPKKGKINHQKLKKSNELEKVSKQVSTKNTSSKFYPNETNEVIIHKNLKTKNYSLNNHFKDSYEEIPFSTPTRPRNILEISRDNEVYNKSLFPSSLFDLVQRIEEIEQSSYSLNYER